MKNLKSILLFLLITSNAYCATTYEILSVETTNRIINNGTMIVTNNLVYSNQDYSFSILGYEKLTLTTDMVLVQGDSTTNATTTSPIPATSFVNAFDSSMSSGTTTGMMWTTTDRYHRYVISLPTNYSGFVIVNGTVKTYNDSNPIQIELLAGYGGYINTTVDSGKDFTQFNTAATTGKGGFRAQGSSLNGGFRFVGEFMGDRVILYVWGNGIYRFYDVSIYGSTNGFQNFTGKLPSGYESIY